MIEKSIKCTACGACLEICPKNAITMQSEYGYKYPSIDQSLCIKCGLCSNVCMLNKPNEENCVSYKKYAFRMNSLDILNSSSGGFCYSLSVAFINNKKGIVYAAVFNKTNKVVEHKRLTSVGEIKASRGSKYVKSEHCQVFKLIKNDLNKMDNVLFIGMPCEVQGLLNYLGKEFPNLYTVSLLCGGAVSNVFFTKYLAEIENKFKNRVQSINFRNKTYGSNIYCTSINFDNGEEKILNHRYDYFIALEGSNYVRPSCHICNFTPESAKSDFVVGDCFGGESRENGVSAVFVKQQAKTNDLIGELGLQLTFNDKIRVSSRAINNKNLKQSNTPTEDTYKKFYFDTSKSLKYAIKVNVFKNYSVKQRIYGVLPIKLKAFLVNKNEK